MTIFLWVVLLLAGVAVIVWGAEQFAEHLGSASVALGVSSFALALLLAGAEPEELATAIVASARHSPGIAVGDVIGANVAICLVALGVGAWIAPLAFPRRVLWYAWLGIPMGIISIVCAWDGNVSRAEGGFLVACYIAYVAGIWIVERHPPALGETGELEEIGERGVTGTSGSHLLWVLLGVAATAGGATLIVDAVRHISPIQSMQTRLGLTLVGFATAFELVVLAWSAARRGASEAVIAAVVGSFAYNATMTLGAAALVHPLVLARSRLLHSALVVMPVSLAIVIAFAAPKKVLTRLHGAAMLILYVVFLWLVLRW